jgi:cell wall-associated NlpC family hydrolase
MSDRRITPANGRVAHIGLRGAVTAARYVEGARASVAAPLADLLAAPGGARDRQLLMGDGVLILERSGGFAFLQSDKDGYCGYVSEAALGNAVGATHWVCAPASHLYPAADMKCHEIAALSFGARIAVAAEDERFFEAVGRQFVPRAHLAPIGQWMQDPATVAEMFLGVPYLWGGNAHSGIDCSGLVQAALLACGIACPGDSDMQQGLGVAVPDRSELRRGDLIFWKGHVAMALDSDRIIHANAFRMAVSIERTDAAIARIAAQGDGPPTGLRRVL